MIKVAFMAELWTRCYLYIMSFMDFQKINALYHNINTTTMHTNARGLCILESVHWAKLHHSAGLGEIETCSTMELRCQMHTLLYSQKLLHFPQTHTFISGIHSKKPNKKTQRPQDISKGNIAITPKVFCNSKPIQRSLFLYNSDF